MFYLKQTDHGKSFVCAEGTICVCFSSPEKKFVTIGIYSYQIRLLACRFKWHTLSVASQRLASF